MILFETDYIQLALDKTVPCLKWIAKKNLISAEFRESEEKSVQFYRQFKAQFPRLEWYVDARNVVAVLPEDTQWVTDEILPKMAAAGLKKEAFVVPTSAVGKMVVKNYVSKAGHTVEIQVFGTEEAAKDWLKV